MTWETIKLIGQLASPILALLIALGFIERLRHRWFGPRLAISWCGRSPFLQRIFAQNINNPAAERELPSVFQMRLKVAVCNKAKATNLAIFIRDACVMEDGAKKAIKDFVPGRLRWTHTQSTNCDLIHGDSWALCDLATLGPKQTVSVTIGGAPRPKPTYELKMCIEGGRGTLDSTRSLNPNKYIIEFDLLSTERGSIPGVMYIESKIDQNGFNDPDFEKLLSVTVQLSSDYELSLS